MRFSVAIFFMFTLLTLTVVVSGAKGGFKKSGKNSGSGAYDSQSGGGDPEGGANEAGKGGKGSGKKGGPELPVVGGLLGDNPLKAVEKLTKIAKLPGLSR